MPVTFSNIFQIISFKRSNAIYYAFLKSKMKRKIYNIFISHSNILAVTFQQPISYFENFLIKVPQYLLKDISLKFRIYPQPRTTRSWVWRKDVNSYIHSSSWYLEKGFTKVFLPSLKSFYGTKESSENKKLFFFDRILWNVRAVKR